MARMVMGFLSGVIKMFWNEIEVVVVQLWENTKSHQTLHLKMMNFMVYEFYLN